MLTAVLLARMKYLGRMVLLAVMLVRELLAVLLMSSVAGAQTVTAPTEAPCQGAASPSQ